MIMKKNSARVAIILTLIFALLVGDITIFLSIRYFVIFHLYRVYKKNVPNRKSLPSWIFCKMTNNNSYQFCSHMFHFVSRGGGSKCIIFKRLEQKKFKVKMNLFCTAIKYGMLLSICKNFRKNDTK